MTTTATPNGGLTFLPSRDVDCLMGGINGTLAYFEDTRASGSPFYKLIIGQEDPFYNIQVTARSSQTYSSLCHSVGPSCETLSS